jgi:hypothetical protein
MEDTTIHILMKDTIIHHMSIMIGEILEIKGEDHQWDHQEMDLIEVGHLLGIMEA